MIPIYLELKDFVSHIHSSVDFTKFNKALIVGSSEGDPNIANGVGKTTLMNAIRFALFGKSPFSNRTKVVRHGADTCFVEFMFDKGDEIFKISRRLTAKTGLMTVEFCKKDGEKWDFEGLTCDTPSKTSQKIIDIIGMNDETFVNISYFRQNDISHFTSGNSTKRKEILKEGLRINIWDEYQEVSKNQEKVINQKILLLDEKIKFFGDLENDIGVINSEILNKNTKLEQTKKTLIYTEGLLKKHNDVISGLELSIATKNSINPDGLKIELTKISEKANNIRCSKDKIMPLIKSNEEKIADIEKKNLEISKINYKNYKSVLITDHKERDILCKDFLLTYNEDVPNIKYYNNDLSEFRNSYDICLKSLNELNFDLKQLLALEPGSECPTCLSVIENPHAIAQKRLVKQTDIENSIEKNNNIIKDLEIKIRECELFIKNAEKLSIEIEKNKFLLLKSETLLKELVNSNNKHHEELKGLLSEWNNLKSRKEEILKILSDSQLGNYETDLKNAILEKERLDLEYDKVKELIMTTSIELGHLAGNKKNIENKLSEKITLSKERDVLISDLIIYSKLSTAFGKDGIQAIIMENITEDLKQYTNSILKDIYHKSISVDFITQKQGVNGSWKESFEIVIFINNEEYDFEDVSGGEQVRISVAIRLALSQLLMQRVGSNIQFILFDEVDQALDKHGLEALFNVINELSRNFKILVISHNDYMKEKFEDIITVHMNSEGSILKLN